MRTFISKNGKTMTAIVLERQAVGAAVSTKPQLWGYLLLGVFGTIFDAYSSWQIIHVTPIALEGNPLWGGIASVVGFDGAMAVRAIGGVSLMLLLWYFANQDKHPQGRAIARFAIRALSVLLVLLCCWHLYGITSYITY